MPHGPMMNANCNFCEGASLADMNAQFEEEQLRKPGLPEGAKVVVKLVGEDGNAFSILGRVSKALRRAGMPEKATEYLARATAGDYDHLLAVTLEYVTEPDGGDEDEG
jgi:hypothetical protein